MLAAFPSPQRGNFFIRSRALLLFITFAIVFTLFLAASIHYSNSTHFTVSDGSPLTIIGAPGELVTITVNAGSSIEGDWATSGVSLSLPSANFSTQLVAPLEPGWSDYISDSSSVPDSDVILSGSFTIPSNLDANTHSLKGVITGDILFPKDYGDFFRDTPKSLNIPVQLLLLSASDMFLSARLPLYLATGLGALLLLILPAFLRLYDRQRKSPFISLYLSKE